MTYQTDAEMKAALRAQIAAYKASHPEPTWNTQLEERMAHVANGGTLRAVPVAHAMEHHWRRGLRDEAGYVSDGTGWRWEPIVEVGDE